MTDVLTVKQIVSAAEALLSKRFGGSQQLGQPEVLGGVGEGTVIRCRVGSSPFLQQRSVVVKHVPATEEERNVDVNDAGLVRKIVAYQFTTTLEEDIQPGPMLLAYDLDARIIVLTDLGDRPTLEEMLTTTDAAGRLSLIRQLGTALGRMHAATSSLESSFAVLLGRMTKKRPGTRQVFFDRETALSDSVPIGLQLVRNAGFEVPECVVKIAEEVDDPVHTPQQWAFTPYDLAPDNIMVTDTIKFLDYEWAGFRDVSFDLASVVAGFPQALFKFSFTDDEVEVFLESWTWEVRHLWPETTQPSSLYPRIVAAMIDWALSSVSIMHYSARPDLAVADRGAARLTTDIPDFLRCLEADDAAPAVSRQEALLRADLHKAFDAIARFASRHAETIANDPGGSNGGDKWDADQVAALVSFATAVADSIGTPEVELGDDE